MSRPLWFGLPHQADLPEPLRPGRATKAPVIGSALDRFLFDATTSSIFRPIIWCRQGLDAPSLSASREAAPDMVLPSQVVEHFIEQAGVHWIMNACICRDASGCRDYPIDLGCLFLGEAAAGINRPSGGA